MKFLFLLIAILIAPLAVSAQQVAAGPMLVEAEREFTTMKTTLYQHKTEVDTAAGSYKYDCVRFVSYAMRQAAPVAWETILRVRGIPKGKIPSPPSFQKFMATLAAKPQPGWEAVARAADLRPGDVVSWDYKTERASGHAVIIASMPSPTKDGSWVVKIYDATSSPHAEDSRPDDARAQIFEVTGRRSGLGHGVMAFSTDASTGALTGYRWTPKGKIITCPIAAGRPLR